MRSMCSGIRYGGGSWRCWPAGSSAAGTLADVIGAEFGITQPAVSQHLRVLREHGFTRVRVDGARRMYAVAPAALREADAWLDQFRGFWEQRLDALGTELARGQRERRRPSDGAARSEGPQDGGQSVGA